MKKEKDLAQQRSMLETDSGQAPPDLERELHALGLPVGERILELLFYREKGNSSPCMGGKREVKIINMLHFVNNQLWKSLFGKPADGLEQSMEDSNEYRILDRTPVTNRFVNLQQPNVAYFIAGIIEGVFCASKMDCRVVPHPVDDTTLFLVKFTDETIQRDEQLA